MQPEVELFAPYMGDLFSSIRHPFKLSEEVKNWRWKLRARRPIKRAGHKMVDKASARVQLSNSFSIFHRRFDQSGELAGKTIRRRWPHQFFRILRNRYEHHLQCVQLNVRLNYVNYFHYSRSRTLYVYECGVNCSLRATNVI